MNEENREMDWEKIKSDMPPIVKKMYELNDYDFQLLAISQFHRRLLIQHLDQFLASGPIMVGARCALGVSESTLWRWRQTSSCRIGKLILKLA